MFSLVFLIWTNVRETFPSKADIDPEQLDYISTSLAYVLPWLMLGSAISKWRLLGLTGLTSWKLNAKLNLSVERRHTHVKPAGKSENHPQCVPFIIFAETLLQVLLQWNNGSTFSPAKWGSYLTTRLTFAKCESNTANDTDTVGRLGQNSLSTSPSISICFGTGFHD